MRASLADAAEQLLNAWPQLVANGMPNDEGGIRALASSGLVQFLWRNGPVEDAHASRRGPSDGQMMTMSIELCRRARRAIDNPQIDLIGFETQLLDVERPWPGTSTSTRSLLHGHIAEIRKHVKASVNQLLAIERQHSTDALRKFLCLNGESRHVGMPDWPDIVDIVSDFVEGRIQVDSSYVRLQLLPDSLTAEPKGLGSTLLDPPSNIAADDLQGLIDSGVLMAAESIMAERRRGTRPLHDDGCRP